MANIDEMKQEAADKKAAKKADKAYMGSLTSTMPAPKKPAMPKSETKMFDDEEAAFKRGGKVGSASKRADGIASKGKTRGTMIMCGGGKM
jgi:hypothetical protein